MARKTRKDDSEELHVARLELASALASLRKPNDVERFFEDVFTKAETRDIALRWRIFQLLDEGVPQRAILTPPPLTSRSGAPMVVSRTSSPLVT